MYILASPVNESQKPAHGVFALHYFPAPKFICMRETDKDPENSGQASLRYENGMNEP